MTFLRQFFERSDAILRRSGWAAEPASSARGLARLLAAIVVFGMVYGAVMGSYSALDPERLAQILYSASKVPILLLGTFLIGLPSFFVFNTLLGLRSDFPEALRALLATQAGLAIVLASLAPLTAFWYVSSAFYQSAVLVNGIMFAIASFSAQVLLRDYYRPLIERNPRHRRMVRLWLAIYIFIGIQMAWVLRPFIGTPDSPVRFFRQGAWGNAYVELIELAARIIGS